MRRESGQLEEQIVRVVGAVGAATVSEVRASLGDSLAHTTVMTSLVRLTNKGLLVRSRSGRSFTYSLAAPIESMSALRAALRMRTELDSKAERSEVLANFVATLDPEDEATLLQLLSAGNGKRESAS